MSRVKARWMVGVLVGAICAVCVACDDEEAQAPEAEKSVTSDDTSEAKQGEEAETPKEPSSGPAKLTIVHAGLGVDEVQLILDGRLLPDTKPFGAFEGKPVYVEVPSGNHLLAVGQPSKKEGVIPPPLVTRSVELKAQASYTLLLAGVYGPRGKGEQALGLFVIPDAQGGETAKGKAPLRAIHGVVNAPPVDVTSGRKGAKPALMLVNVGFGKASAFHSMMAGPDLLEFRSGLDSEAAPIYVSKRVVLAEGVYTTLLWLGKVGSTEHPPRLWALSADAAVARAL